MKCPHCGNPLLYGVVGRAEGQPDVWAMVGYDKWSATTMLRAQQEADERTRFAGLGVRAFVGRVWEPVPLSAGK